ncbi:hypothetical protein UK23_30000 [Lentzea aerocolonigenes]|uniref:Uncharacterized protein n=1 Tax=Lentzea aerocolonigenes TaxID=68170 RepID=A0A0F0GL79_LENAE|nr:hypothetical protein [Lentzea aerocolonigenes]KJK44269.1 hypothetical protein UK23_30000 [Lentzea aerocolonigenes]
MPWDVELLSDRCLAPLPGGWLARTADGLVALDAGLLCPPPLIVEDYGDEAWRDAVPALHTSPDGRYAAVVNDYGNLGVVVDLASGEVVLSLDRDHVHTATTTPFPIAFLPGDRVVAATGVCRLDVIDLGTGAVLTERDTEFDEYHGRLTASPCGRWFVDHRWLWQPDGAPAVVDVDEWVRSGGEPEGTYLAFRDYPWDQPVAWLSSGVVAVQRTRERHPTIDSVEIYDVERHLSAGPPVGLVPGVAGPMWAYDRTLYVVGEAGLEIWDPLRGALVGLVEEFWPVAHRDGVFAELRDGWLYSFSVD